MALSSGTRSILVDAMSWVAAGLIIAAGVTHRDELHALVGKALALAPPPAAETSPNALSAADQQTSRGRTVEIRAEASGHYFANAYVNGREIGTLVDTGATMLSLTYEDAERAGLHLRREDFTGRVNTANGTARVAVVTLDRVEIGGLMVRNVKATVSEAGRLTTTLLGMSFLSRLAHVDMRQGVLVLSD